MSGTGLEIPTRVAPPRCFFLAPVINKSQSYTQAGEYKSKVFFGINPKQLLRAFLAESAIVALKRSYLSVVWCLSGM